MEIINNFKENGYFTAELYHLLNKKKIVDPQQEQIIPSDYVREMKMSTEERLKHLNNMEIQNIFNKPESNAVLSFSPRLIVFQNFKPYEKIVTKFIVTNISKAPTYLKLDYKESSLFFLKPCGGQLLSRLAPGISVTFAVTFTPQQFEDNVHRVTFYTESDRYILPLIAMGPRPIFDFPDQIVVPKTPLKIENSHTINVHNLGGAPGGFKISCKTPFSSVPYSASLSPGERVNVTIKFRTMHTGEIRQTMLIALETGENFRVNLIGTTFTVSVELEKSTVRFLDTFNTMMRQQTLKIHNKSPYPLTYMIMKNRCVSHDFDEKFNLAHILYSFKESESKKYEKLIIYDVVSSEEHERVYTRIFFDELYSLIADQSITYQNRNFEISPIKGTLWPEKETELTITFTPKEIDEFQTIAFLDVDGVSDRMPIRIFGTSLPPELCLNVEHLNLGQVFINKTYNYEIVVMNRGHIDGVVEYKEVPTIFQSAIKCMPTIHCLAPGHKEVFVISFTNSNQGPFFEEINFIIRDTKVVLKLYLKGEIIYPSLVFSKPILDFGNVSVGVPTTLELDVINESEVEGRASLKVSSDGPEISSITLTDYEYADTPKPQIPEWPREFTIEPSRFQFEPLSRIPLKIILTANLVRANQTALELEFEQSDSPPIVLPIVFNATVPEITPAPDIVARAWFLEFTYNYDVLLESNEFNGYFTVVECEVNDSLHVTVFNKEGHIAPNSTILIPIGVKASSLGQHEYTLRLHLFGVSHPIDVCNIRGCAVRPIVTAFPTSLHFGNCKLLQKFQKTITLINDSPVTINYTTSLLHRDERWQVDPSEDKIGPESETVLLVSLYLIDADTYTNKIIIQLDNAKDILVPLSAIGVGTSIVVGPLRDRIDLGRNFVKIPLGKHVVMENLGTRFHILEWTHQYKTPKTQPITSSFYDINPKSFRMGPGQKFEITVTGMCMKSTKIEEIWYLVGSVESLNKKELLMECAIFAEFVEPKIELSESIIEFQYDYGPYGDFYKITHILAIKNVSTLPLYMEISVKPPFAIIERQNSYKIPPEEENICSCIYYDTTDINMENLIKEIGPEKSKDFIDCLTHKRIEPTRKEPLQFFEDINKIKAGFKLIHAIEEHMDDENIMKLQIVFDTTKHQSLRSRLYNELLRIKFRGHKNKDWVKLVGKINSPNIMVLTPKIDFNCLLNGAMESRTIKIQNVTPLPACYTIKWKKSNIRHVLPEQDFNIEKSVIDPTPATSYFMTDTYSNVTHPIFPCGEPPAPVPTAGGDGDTDYTFGVQEQVSSLLSLPESEFEKIRLMQKILPMIEFEHEPLFVWRDKLPAADKIYDIQANDVFQLMPHRGLLKPKEIQYVQIVFRPTSNIIVNSILEIQVLGGPCEYVTITGQSSDLMYRLNSNKLNFKIRSFHTTATEDLIISNTAAYDFKYKTYLNEPKVGTLSGIIVNLEPAESILEPFREKHVSVVVRPGVLGYFERQFLLEVAHLAHIPIKVFGWGVVPQVYLSLQRPEINNLPIKLGYKAIPLLTTEYLDAVNDIFSSNVLTKDLNPTIEEDVNYDSLPDWHVCSSWDVYPTVMDIELAIERMLVIDHIKAHPELLHAYTTSGKNGPIQGFYTTPYLIDYGVVITGCSAHCIADIINYGPIPAKLYYDRTNQIPKWLSIKLCAKLNPRESGKLEVIFSPTDLAFPEYEQTVETEFTLVVPYGVSIPVQVKAICAVPYLMSNITLIDFGMVRCGDKVICTIPLKNVGRPTCLWYATLKIKAPGYAMQVLDTSGKFKAGESGWLSISFKPTMEMLYEGLLVFRFHMNPNKMTIPVVGQGMVPHVQIIGPDVNFPATLPWVETTEMYFGITNPCSFPVEIIFPHSDVKWKEEEELYNLLNNYYDRPEELLVPILKPGVGMPSEVTSFFSCYQDSVKKAMQDDMAASAKYAATLRQSASRQGGIPSNSARKEAKKKSPKVNVTGKKQQGDIASAAAHKTEAEYGEEQIKKMKSLNLDPLGDCLKVMNMRVTPVPEVKTHKGTIIMVHGSPGEEIRGLEIAYALGKRLKIPTINIDSCFVQALIKSESVAKNKIMLAVNELYAIYQKSLKKDENVMGEEQEVMDNRDEHDILMDKLVNIAHIKTAGTPRSKAKDGKRKRSSALSLGDQSALGAVGSSTMFQLDLLEELLVEHFELPIYNQGFVVDTLGSILFKDPTVVITNILRYKKNIWNVHLILCHSEFHKWAKEYEETQKALEPVEPKPKEYTEQEVREIVVSVEEMDEEEYNALNPELKAIYVTNALEERRKKHLEKKGIRVEEPSSPLPTKKGKASKDSKSHVTETDDNTKKKKGELKSPVSKPSPEYLTKSAKYNDYLKFVYDSLITIAHNWVFEEADVGIPLLGHTGDIISGGGVVGGGGAPQKKAKTKRSDVQLSRGSTDLPYPDRGFPIVIVMGPSLQYKDAVVEMFARTPIVVEALRAEEQEDVLQTPVARKEYTVILPKELPEILSAKPLMWHFLSEPPIKKCECNLITDFNLMDDTTQDNVLNVLSKWHCTCGKRMLSTVTSTSDLYMTTISSAQNTGSKQKVVDFEYEQDKEPSPLYSVHTTTDPVTEQYRRLVLDPGDLVRCKYTFNPQREGHYTEKRYVDVSGWPESRAVVTVKAICDIPRLDSRPKKMFANFVRRTVDDKMYKLAYLDDRKCFEFGPIFIGPHRVYEEEYKIDLRNSSLIVARVTLEFLEEQRVFQIHPKEVVLEPGERAKVKLTAAPDEVGSHKTELILSVKDNPEIIEIPISCKGVTAHVEILPLTKVIDFGKHLLYRREDDRFIVKNDSVLPIMWKIRNAEDFVNDFIISKVSGIVPQNDNEVVPVTYIACNIGIISARQMTIFIYDEQGRGSPMIVDTLSLSAECYDVKLDCAYEDPATNHLDYGNVKVNSTVTREMYLLNRGKYNIYFKLKKVKNFPEPALLKSFEVSQEQGIVPPSVKLVVVEFSCTPTTSLNLTNVPAFTCSLLDGSKEQVVVAKFPVCITIASFYNTFTLFPLGELNFNIIPIGSGVIRDVIINNTSKCPFTYEIIVPEKYQVEEEMLPAPTKTNKNALLIPPLYCGNFVIIVDDYLVAPGTTRTIPIQFNANKVGTFEETIKFIVSDTCRPESCGVPLRLVGTGALPTLDFWNVETTFREHLIVKTLSDYKVPEPSPHAVFVEDTVTLYFFSVIINTSFTAILDLYNNGLVSSAVTMKIHQSNLDEGMFTLDKNATHIQPLLHKTMGIIFSPRVLKEYRGVLEIKLKLLNNQEKIYKICLIGEGVIPRIKLVSPKLRHKRTGVLRFPVTCLGSVTTRRIIFINISSTKSCVEAIVNQSPYEDKPEFWLVVTPDTEDKMKFGNNDLLNTTIQILLGPTETATIIVNFYPLNKGKIHCDVTLSIRDNPYEDYVIVCDAEAFSEEVVLLDLEMLPMDIDIDSYKLAGTPSVPSRVGSTLTKKSRRRSERLSKTDTSVNDGPAVLRYLLDFGGCELGKMQRRSLVMVNNSEKVYKFDWAEAEYVVVKPSLGYIAPGEEKDLEIMFLSNQIINLQREDLPCTLTAITDDTTVIDSKGATWDNRQTVTAFEHNPYLSVNERYQVIAEEAPLPASEGLDHVIQMVVVYSAVTEYIKYTCDLPDQLKIPDTFIYQTRTFEFTIRNTGRVSMKISWDFELDEEFPTRNDKYIPKETEIAEVTLTGEGQMNGDNNNAYKDIIPVDAPLKEEESFITLFSGNLDRDSVDTWFEVDLPFQIEPVKECLKPGEQRVFKVTFAPFEAFLFKVRLKSTIDNLDPYDENAMCKITARSLIPYCHLDVEESDYISGGRRKIVGTALPEQLTILEFNVLGAGCYKKTFNVINPTTEPYEFNFEMKLLDDPELIPFHCDMLKGFVEGGTSTEVAFTFTPTAAGVYESLWKFIIPCHKLVMDVLVVGVVRQAEVSFVPTILIITNSLVGFTSTHPVMLKNDENEPLQFQFKGNSLINESGKTPVVVSPEQGVLKPCSETPINIIYTPDHDGPKSFKIFCSITTRDLILCVNALSYSINPKVTYLIVGNEHLLQSTNVTHIHLEQTVSTYERQIPFTIANDGSATFFFEWHYNPHHVKRYLQISVEPRSGHVAPAQSVECVLHFNLKQVPVHAFPVTLSISDGPEYSIMLFAELTKPNYRFSCKTVNFGKCIVNAPDQTYKKYILLHNDDKEPIIVDLNFTNEPDLLVDFPDTTEIAPHKKNKIKIYFRPKQIMEYEYKLQFWVNSLCEEIITVRGEGVPLLFDLYEGCQKTFNIGHVKIGEKVVRQIEVMNYSKVPIDATMVFTDICQKIDDEVGSEATSICLKPSFHSTIEGPSRVKMLKTHKDNKIKEQIAQDLKNALLALKVIPNKVLIPPLRKVPLKIQFKPTTLITNVDVQLNMRVLNFERPLVKLSGAATGMRLCLSQTSLQFGTVRKRGLKTLKVMLLNKGDFSTRFFWQPLKTKEFMISPLQGQIAPHTNVTFTISYRPTLHNPFVKVWASCNIDNYVPLELALYAACLDVGTVSTHTITMQCPVREVITEHLVVTNPTDDVWTVLSELSGDAFVTLKEFPVEPNSTFEIPIIFKPKIIGSHQCQILYSPLGNGALFVNVFGTADHPNPNDSIQITVQAKEPQTHELIVRNITEKPESYIVSSEIVRTVPDKFGGYYEMKHPQTIKVWGEASATCRWTFVCYEECEMYLKVMFVNEDTHEYQYYNIMAIVTASKVVDTLEFKSAAREMMQREIIVANPLSTDAVFFVKCSSLTVPETLKIPRNSEAALTMTYAPLVVGTNEDYLEVSNELVGTYLYKVILKCTPGKEKEHEIKTFFGARVPIRLRVHNKTESSTDFECVVDHGSIIANKEYSLNASEKGKFLVYFEPIEMGKQNCKITFSSPTAGEFVFNIKGHATRPKPQGPYEIKSGGFATIVFKNVFYHDKTFTIQTDREEFYVKKAQETVKAKTEVMIMVYLAEQKWDVMPTGSLTLASGGDTDPPIMWTYFLKGIP